MATTSRLGRVPASGIKAPVVAATTAEITLSGEQTIDGIVCLEGDRVLVKDQADTTENGVYVVSTAGWELASDWNHSSDVLPGMLVIDANGATFFMASFTGAYTPGTTELTFSGVLGTLTNANVKSMYEANADTNAFTSALLTKLNAIEELAKDDLTAAEVKTLYESNDDTNAFTTALLAKLNAIEELAKDDLSAAEIKALYESNADTNAFDNTYKTAVDSLMASGIDAGTLGGLDPAYFLNRENHTGTYNPPVITTFTASGSWTKPTTPPVAFVKVTVIGAGSEGGDIGSGSEVAARSGAAGGTSIKIIPASSLNGTEAITVGTAAGGSSAFGSHCSATGASDVDSPGSGSGGHINITGLQGGYGGVNTLGGPSALPGYGNGGSVGNNLFDPALNPRYGIVIVEEYY